MLTDLKVFNTLSGKKEEFAPLNSPLVGMYVCGPTVYGDPHLGNARPYITFDIVFRYLIHLGYKVRYVRNITDVGHLEQDLDEGEDKIEKRARLENLEPMEVVQQFTDRFHHDMKLLNILNPSIEPRASGHIPEQIEMISQIIDRGYAYDAEGSVYFDVVKYNTDHHYGQLSGRVLEDMMSGTRALKGQEKKKNPVDFALWKKASPEHIMRWKSPWSEGYPGWHLECSAMSIKYLGKEFDIHGGGMDLLFPHHECEIAQAQASHETTQAKYWLHNNLITINGQKMGKSLGNVIALEELFTGNHDLLNRAYSPMTIRFFILQSHYRSTLDFSNKALEGARKGFNKMINGLKTIRQIDFPVGVKEDPDEKLNGQIHQLCENSYRAMNDDFNTALAIGHLFNLLKKINSLHTGQIKFEDLGSISFLELKETYITFVENILGLVEEKSSETNRMISVIVDLYALAKKEKDYQKVDMIRDQLKAQGVVLKDMKSGVDWGYEE